MAYAGRAPGTQSPQTQSTKLVPETAALDGFLDHRGKRGKSGAEQNQAGLLLTRLSVPLLRSRQAAADGQLQLLAVRADGL